MPREKMLINADIYEPLQKGGRPPKPNEGTRVLLETVEQLGLGISWDVGLHSGVGMHDDFIRTVEKPTKN